MEAKSFIRNNGITVLSVIEILALLLPFARVTVSMSVLGTSTESESNISSTFPTS